MNNDTLIDNTFQNKLTLMVSLPCIAVSIVYLFKIIRRRFLVIQPPPPISIQAIPLTWQYNNQSTIDVKECKLTNNLSENKNISINKEEKFDV